MKGTMGAGCGLLVGILLATSAVAGQYDFEVGLAFDSTQFESSQTVTTAFGSIMNATETDTDNLSLLGSWYFAGLSDDKGPKARAVFVDRASSFVVGFSRLDQKFSAVFSSEDPAFPFPDTDSSFSSDGDSLAMDLRYVDRISGWFGTAGLLDSDVSVSGTVEDSIDASGWSLGVGKYLFDNTAISLALSQVDAGGGADTTATAVSFTHLADLGGNWQYAIDLGYRRLDADLGAELDTWSAAFAFYPTRDFEFGIAVEDGSGNNNQPVGLVDTTSIGAFASWFVRSNIRLAARFSIDDVDDSGDDFAVSLPASSSDTDQDSFGISAAIRF